MNKTVLEAIPELQGIAKELGVSLNDFRVVKEYFKRHPKEN